MRALRKLYQQDIAFQGKDWKGRDVFCDKNTIKNHVARLHPDAALAVDRVKADLADPHYVVECRGAESENAIYSLTVGDHPWVVVAIKSVWVVRKKLGVPKHVRVVSTFYPCTQDDLKKELSKGKLILKKT